MSGSIDKPERAHLTAHLDACGYQPEQIARAKRSGNGWPEKQGNPNRAGLHGVMRPPSPNYALHIAMVHRQAATI